MLRCCERFTFWGPSVQVRHYTSPIWHTIPRMTRTIFDSDCLYLQQTAAGLGGHMFGAAYGTRWKTSAMTYRCLRAQTHMRRWKASSMSPSGCRVGQGWRKRVEHSTIEPCSKQLPKLPQLTCGYVTCQQLPCWVAQGQ